RGDSIRRVRCRDHFPVSLGGQVQGSWTIWLCRNAGLPGYSHSGLCVDLEKGCFRLGVTPMTGDTRPCPVCGETIKAVALKCRFCNTDLQAFAANQQLQTEKDLFFGHPAVFYSVGQLLPFLVVIVLAIPIGYVVGTATGIFYTVLGALAVC